MRELVIDSPTYGKHTVLYDEEDHELISGRIWYIGPHHTKKFYCKSNPSKSIKSVLMHRLIMNPPKGKLIDHINGNTLDNRKCNLRLATPSQNVINQGISKSNTTGYKGVCFFKRVKKYIAYGNSGCKRYHLGYFHNPIEAAKAYNNFALKHHGEFARLNEIPC